MIATISFIVGLGFGFLIGAVWHGIFSPVNEQDAYNRGYEHGRESR